MFQSANRSLRTSSPKLSRWHPLRSKLVFQSLPAIELLSLCIYREVGLRSTFAAMALTLTGICKRDIDRDWSCCSNMAKRCRRIQLTAQILAIYTSVSITFQRLRLVFDRSWKNASDHTSSCAVCVWGHGRRRETLIPPEQSCQAPQCQYYILRWTADETNEHCQWRDSGYNHRSSCCSERRASIRFDCTGSTCHDKSRSCWQLMRRKREHC